VLPPGAPAADCSSSSRGHAAPHLAFGGQDGDPRRAVRRNRETLREWLSPQHPVWSAAATFAERREYLFDRTSRSAHCRTVRCTSPREFERWYQQL
jgi:hypothetical protein